MSEEWWMYFTQSGEPYYHNTATRVTTWEEPVHDAGGQGPGAATPEVDAWSLSSPKAGTPAAEPSRAAEPSGVANGKQEDSSEGGASEAKLLAFLRQHSAPAKAIKMVQAAAAERVVDKGAADAAVLQFQHELAASTPIDDDDDEEALEAGAELPPPEPLQLQSAPDDGQEDAARAAAVEEAPAAPLAAAEVPAEVPSGDSAAGAPEASPAAAVGAAWGGIEAANQRELLAVFLKKRAAGGDAEKAKATLRAAAQRGMAIPGLGTVVSADVEDVIAAFELTEFGRLARFQ